MASLECPACWNQLVPTPVKDLTVDVCHGCGGIWFDAGELARVDNPRETGEVLLAIERDVSVGVRHDQARSCPRCEAEMDRRAYGPASVQIDECPGCNGIFLDAGELEVIRQYQRGRKDPSLVGSGLYSESEGPPSESTRRIAEILGIVVQDDEG